DQVILLNQTGRTSHEDICSSLELFAREVMPDFHAREPEHQRWKADVLAGRIQLESLDTDGFKVYSHQNEDIVRLTSAGSKQRRTPGEAARGAVAATAGGGSAWWPAGSSRWWRSCARC